MIVCSCTGATDRDIRAGRVKLGKCGGCAPAVAKIRKNIPEVQSYATLEHCHDVLLCRVHASAACAGRPCPLHNRTDHHMRGFPQHYREDRGFMERICPHGVGHPDPDCIRADPVHGCDGCCRENRSKQ